MTPECKTETCPMVGRISTLEARISHATSGNERIENKLDSVLLAMGKIEVIGVEIQKSNEAISRAFSEIDNERRKRGVQADKIDELERKQDRQYGAFRTLSIIGTSFWALVLAMLGWIMSTMRG